ncbi:cytochrome c oxidase subunit 3 [Ravibacter arvi]
MKEGRSTVAEFGSKPNDTLSMDPVKFMVWLLLLASVMLFASQTSAYLVKRAEGNWLEFTIPGIFTYSTIVLVLSSVTMHWAYLEAKKDNFSKLKLAVTVTFLLGVVFLAMQVLGWGKLVEMNVYFVGNLAGSFFYVFTFLHLVHLILGLLALLSTLWAATKMKVHSKRLRRIEVCATIWHFLDILWIYLFVFLLTFN